jgi:hypothetical protein
MNTSFYRIFIDGFFADVFLLSPSNDDQAPNCACTALG